MTTTIVTSEDGEGQSTLASCEIRCQWLTSSSISDTILRGALVAREVPEVIVWLGEENG